MSEKTSAEYLAELQAMEKHQLITIIICMLVEINKREQEQGELRLRRAWMASMPFCPDHRDKVKGLWCRQCEIERLTGYINRVIDGTWTVDDLKSHMRRT